MAMGDKLAEDPEAFCLPNAVHPAPAGPTDGLDDAITPLPGTQGVGIDARKFDDGFDIELFQVETPPKIV